MRAQTNNAPEIDGSRGGVDLEEFLSMLDKVQKHGRGYIARCPAHNDGRPSLRVSSGDKGILVKCWAGCSYHEIVGALGLRPQDLFRDALTEENKAKYQYRGLLKEIRFLTIHTCLCQSDLEKGLLSDSEKYEFAGKIELLNKKKSEAEQLRKQHGLQTSHYS